MANIKSLTAEEMLLLINFYHPNPKITLIKTIIELLPEEDIKLLLEILKGHTNG